MNLEKERDAALEKARSFARTGNGVWVQLWLDRAVSFAPVSKRRVSYLQKLLDESKGAAK